MALSVRASRRRDVPTSVWNQTNSGASLPHRPPTLNLGGLGRRRTSIPVVSSASMFHPARHLIRCIGFFCLLLMIATTVPTSEAQACSPVDTSVAGSTSVSDTAPAVSDGCGDCGLSCAHGCCHAAHVAIVGNDDISLPKLAMSTPSQWRHMADQPLTKVSGPERPPRA